MESMLNKLRSTVSSAASNAVSNAVSIASQVSNYLPGNPVTREYEATEHIASAGRGLMWKIYKGYKKSTKQEAAIFLFEKRQLDKWDRQERELMLEKIKKGVSQLTRLRHPQILTVQHPLEESRETLAFATEPVHSSLANILGKQENMPSPPPSYLKDFKFYDVEIKYGLMQISEGLGFLHNSVKIVHRGISPENIVLNHQGAWKLFGFDFCVSNSATADQPPMWPFEDYESSCHEFSQPEMDYLSPEYALTHKLEPSADIFSLGVLIHALYNKGKPVYQNHNDFAIFKRHASELKKPNQLQLDGIPEVLKGQLKLMLNATPQLRPDALQFVKNSYFDDIGVKTLAYLDQLFQWDNMQKSQFFKSLPQILPQLPHRVLLLRVIPSLVKECVNPTMIPFILPILLHVADKATKEEFVRHILPHLKPIMKITEPIQVMLLLMMKMELLLSKTPSDDIRTDTLPLLYRALECDTQQIQELCLSVIPTCAPLVDHSTMKNALLPRIKKLCISTSYLSVRVNCLVCIGKVLEHLDKWLVLDDIIPFLENVPSREAPVVMAMVGIFKITLYHKKLGISKEVIATKVLPFLFPLSIENSLTPTQHASIMTLIKDMFERVETEHRAKLEHLHSIRKEQKSLEMSMPTTLSPSENDGAAKDALNDILASCNLESTSSSSLFVDGNNSLISSSHFPTSRPIAEKQRLTGQQNAIQNKLPNPIMRIPAPPQPANPLSGSNVNLLSQSNSTNTLITANLNNLSSLSSSKAGKQQMDALSHHSNNVNNSPANWASPPQAFNNGCPNWTATSFNNSFQQPSFQPQFLNQQTFINFNNTSQPRFGNPDSIGMQLNLTQPSLASNQILNNYVTSMTSAQAPNNSSNSAFKPLSSSDINDLLS